MTAAIYFEMDMELKERQHRCRVSTGLMGQGGFVTWTLDFMNGHSYTIVDHGNGWKIAGTNNRVLAASFAAAINAYKSEHPEEYYRVWRSVHGNRLFD